MFRFQGVRFTDLGFERFRDWGFSVESAWGSVENACTFEGKHTTYKQVKFEATALDRTCVS